MKTLTLPNIKPFPIQPLYNVSSNASHVVYNIAAFNRSKLKKTGAKILRDNATSVRQHHVKRL